MFTGLVEEVGVVRGIVQRQHSAHVTVQANAVLAGLKLGDSIAVNGACLTVVRFDASTFTADAVPETLRMTNLGGLTSGSRVNLERALRVGDRLGGHIVAGHVDGVGRLTSVANEGIAKVLSIEAPPDLLRYVASKGSICIDGVSLTVMDVGRAGFRVSIIPHTASATTLTDMKVGHVCNLECDVIAKYVERLITGEAQSASFGLGTAGPAAVSASSADAGASAGGGTGASCGPRAPGGSAREPETSLNIDFLRKHGFA